MSRFSETGRKHIALICAMTFLFATIMFTITAGAALTGVKQHEIISEKTPRSHRLAISGSHMYVSDDAGLQIFDISKPALPQLITTVTTTPYPSQSVAVRDDYLFVTYNDSATPYLFVYSITDLLGNVAYPGPIKALVKYTGTSNPGFVQVTVHGNYAYLIDFNKITIINISEIPNASSYTVPNTVDWFDTNLTDPYAKVIVETAFDETNMYVSYYDGTFRVYDIASNPMNPTAKGAYRFHFNNTSDADTAATINNIIPHGEYVYLAIGTNNQVGAASVNGLYAMRVSAEGIPTIAGQFQLGAGATRNLSSAAIEGDRAYVHDVDGKRILTLDISDVADIKLLEGTNTLSQSEYPTKCIVKNGKYIYIADQLSGVGIYRIMENVPESLQIMQSGNVVNEESWTMGALTAEATVMNDTNETMNPVLILALYENNYLKAVEIDTHTIPAGDSWELSTAAVTVTSTETQQVKAMIWTDWQSSTPHLEMVHLGAQTP